MIKKAKNKGFSLMELLVVLGIVALLAAVAFPMIIGTLPRYRLRAAARELVINFKKAKLEAVKRNKRVVIEFTPELVNNEGGGYQIYVDETTPWDSYNPPPGGNDVELLNLTMPKTTVLDATTFGGNDTGFDSRAMPLENGSVQIRTSDDSQRYQLVLSSTGTTRLETSSDQGATWTAY